MGAFHTRHKEGDQGAASILGNDWWFRFKDFSYAESLRDIWPDMGRLSRPALLVAKEDVLEKKKSGSGTGGAR
jgi:hypothetical protein